MPPSSLSLPLSPVFSTSFPTSQVSSAPTTSTTRKRPPKAVAVRAEGSEIDSPIQPATVSE